MKAHMIQHIVNIQKNSTPMTLILTYIVKVTVLSNLQEVLAVARCLLKSYKQKKFKKHTLPLKINA